MWEEVVVVGGVGGKGEGGADKWAGVQASTNKHTHTLLSSTLIDGAPLDTDQVLPSCYSHTCLLSAT